RHAGGARGVPPRRHPAVRRAPAGDAELTPVGRTPAGWTGRSSVRPACQGGPAGPPLQRRLCRADLPEGGRSALLASRNLDMPLSAGAIKQKAREMGFDLCGIAAADAYPELAFL